MKTDEKKALPTIERRCYVTELREADEGGKITGYAAVFGKRSEELWGFYEVVEPGAFTEAIQQDDVRALWNHDPNYVLGRNKAGTLTLREDDHGLYIEIDPPDTTWARDLVTSIRRGDVTQMSFGFRVVSERWERKDDDVIRYVEKVKLYDVSPVTYPAYPDTEVQARTMFAERVSAIKDENAAPAAKPEEEERGAAMPPLDIRKKEVELLKLKGACHV